MRSSSRVHRLPRLVLLDLSARGVGRPVSATAAAMIRTSTAIERSEAGVVQLGGGLHMTCGSPGAAAADVGGHDGRRGAAAGGLRASAKPIQARSDRLPT